VGVLVFCIMKITRAEQVGCDLHGRSRLRADVLHEPLAPGNIDG
jgi:hypothetical protein